LADEAAKTSADIIVLCGVHFMAETAKLMSPKKKVLLPAMDAGCSLAASITGEDVRLLKKKYPGVPVVSYVNTSADVKAETDVCCTSANAVKVVESLKTDRVIFLPDQHLANYVAKQTKVKIISWKGSCIVHEQFTPKEIQDIRNANPGIKVIGHPECPSEVLDACDFAGSTGGMMSKCHMQSQTRRESTEDPRRGPTRSIFLKTTMLLSKRCAIPSSANVGSLGRERVTAVVRARARSIFRSFPGRNSGTTLIART
jgi:quinolinate synthetase A subunit